MTKIILGAPSREGKGANVLVKEAFGKAKFPLKLIFTNQLPRDIALPEIGLFLKHVCNADHTTEQVKVASFDALMRVASSIEQIAQLNKCQEAMIIDDGIEAAKSVEQPAEAQSEAEPEVQPEAVQPQAETATSAKRKTKTTNAK